MERAGVAGDATKQTIQKEARRHVEGLTSQPARSRKGRRTMTADKHKEDIRPKLSAPQNRKCIVCRSVKPRSRLFRIATDIDATPVIDWIGTQQSRGCYVCHLRACMSKLAVAPLMVERHLKGKFSLQSTSELTKQIQDILEKEPSETQADKIT